MKKLGSVIVLSALLGLGAFADGKGNAYYLEVGKSRATTQSRYVSAPSHHMSYPSGYSYYSASYVQPYTYGWGYAPVYAPYGYCYPSAYYACPSYCGPSFFVGYHSHRSGFRIGIRF